MNPMEFAPFAHALTKKTHLSVKKRALFGLPHPQTEPGGGWGPVTAGGAVCVQQDQTNLLQAGGMSGDGTTAHQVSRQCE